ncbi:hypothetical protein RchiOBHm_Chr4g0420331 [Rosa chinensis]|uniref:At4g15545-like C-terminal domain-containing protein n=1 Tax=Rosa chinensis TaxID=74649 RepID=A0A2P6QXS7_ROSCH|nr:uncharacterized protein At4g15545 [Rosa chinensis]PRQ39008.1 hypothetical protein RchiOBHm_Chr4g0420331 [Rosa chinensis]
MLARESSSWNFDLPEEVLQVLPPDPFEQLDVARKITSIALATRVSSLESEADALRAQLADKDRLVADLQAQVQSLDASLSDTADMLALAEREKEELLKEKSYLSNTVRKLNRDVSKLEVFRKTLMRSLQEEDESGASEVVAKAEEQTGESLSSQSQTGPAEHDATLPPSKTSSIQSQFSETGSTYTEDRDTNASRAPRISPGLLLASQTSTPRLTPPGSPPIYSASTSPTRTSKPVSPRRHSMSFTTSRGMFDDRSSVPSSHHGSMPGAEHGRTRVDGKEFFRQVRSRLSYEQFGAFLANVKELNAHKQTKEETLHKAGEIFGPDNKDLYVIFEGLISRNVH